MVIKTKVIYANVATWHKLIKILDGSWISQINESGYYLILHAGNVIELTAGSNCKRGKDLGHTMAYYYAPTIGETAVRIIQYSMEYTSVRQAKIDRLNQ